MAIMREQKGTEQKRRPLDDSLRRRLAVAAGLDPETAVLVSMELVRPDGRRVSATCAVAGDLRQWGAQLNAEMKVARGFSDAYSRLMGLAS